MHLGSRLAHRPLGHCLTGLVAQESCRLLDQTLARPPAADPSSLRAGTLSGPGKGAAGGDERGGGQHWSLGCCFLSAGPTPIEVLGSLPAAPSWWWLQRSLAVASRLHPAPVSSWLLPLLSAVSVCLTRMLVDLGPAQRTHNALITRCFT